jgi:hypothetical protein
MPTPHEEGGGGHAHVRTTRAGPCQATPTPNHQHGVKTSSGRVKEPSARGPARCRRAETQIVVSDAPEGPPMADLAYALLLVGGFALLALMLRGLDSL